MEKTFENWLAVSDVDGTLNNKIRRLPRRNYDAIKEFTERGGNFTLASGRLQSSLEHKYTVSWNIAPEYSLENVTADGEIRIEKKGLPSLLIKSFSDATPTYESFYGDEVKGRYCVGYGKLGNCVHIEQNYMAKSLTAVHLLAPDFEQDFANARLLGEVFEFCAKGKKYKVNINNMKYEER